MTPEFSPEFRLLLALVRRGLGTAPDEPPSTAGLRWPDFVTLVERHRLAPFLHRRAAAAITTHCPPAVAVWIAQAAATNLQRALRQAADQIAFTRRLEAAGLEVATVKGLVLAQQLHGGPGARHVGDIDLLVRRSAVATADGMLRASGLRRSRPEVELTPRQFAEYLRLKPEYEYLRAEPPLRLELLWRLEGLPPAESLWPQFIRVDAAGRRWLTLPPTANALYLFQHGARHGWFRLFWLLDVALLQRAPDFNAAALRLDAGRHGGLRALWQGAALAEQFFGVTPSPALLPPPAQRRLVAALTREATRQIMRPTSAKETTSEWFRQTLYRARVPDTLRGRGAMLAPHLASPLNWQTLRLPDRLFFLYPLLSPALWLWRAARRGGWSR